MRTRARRPRWTAAILAAGVLAAACGSGSDGDAERADSTAVSPASQTTEAPVNDEDDGPEADDEEEDEDELRLEEFPVPAGSRPHDVAPAPDGGVWFTAQGAGYLGLLDPSTGDVTQVPLGDGSAPHGVINDIAGNAWVTDGGLNAIVRVDAESLDTRRFPLPAERPDVGVHTATFASDGILWFTGQGGGVYGRLDPDSGDIAVYDAPRGPGPYGITSTPYGDVYFASLAGSYIAKVDPRSGEATVIEPPTPDQGARRIWSDTAATLWVSEWNAGQLSHYNPDADQWREWRLPGDNPQAYSVFVDGRNIVWVSDFGSNQYFRFDPTTEEFTAVELPGPAAEVRQMHGRPGEILGAASALDLILILHTGR